MTAWKTSIQRAASQRFIEALTAAAGIFAQAGLISAVLFNRFCKACIRAFRPEMEDTDPTAPPDDV